MAGECPVASFPEWTYDGVDLEISSDSLAARKRLGHNQPMHHIVGTART
jgi:hypothetical protein